MRENWLASNKIAVWSCWGKADKQIACNLLVKRECEADQCRFLLDTFVLFNWCLISLNCGNSVSVKSTRTESSIIMIIRIPEFYFLLSLQLNVWSQCTRWWFPHTDWVTVKADVQCNYLPKLRTKMDTRHPAGMWMLALNYRLELTED